MLATIILSILTSFLLSPAGVLQASKLVLSADNCPANCSSINTTEFCSKYYNEEDMLDCQYGTYNGPCNCCSPLCYRGPGELCGSAAEGRAVGLCTPNTLCTVTLKSAESYATYVASNAHCRQVGPLLYSPTPSPSPSLTSSVTPTVVPISETSTCNKNQCNMDYCTKLQEFKENKICAANETAFTKVPERGLCQYTTCMACKMFTRPNCTSCPEPVTKRCLRHFYLCLINHYNDHPVLMRIFDNQAKYGAKYGANPGRIVCHVPDIIEYSGSGNTD